jgi:hypothetical protein
MCRYQCVSLSHVGVSASSIETLSPLGGVFYHNASRNGVTRWYPRFRTNGIQTYPCTQPQD